MAEIGMASAERNDEIFKPDPVSVLEDELFFVFIDPFDLAHEYGDVFIRAEDFPNGDGNIAGRKGRGGDLV